jgi:hypothetical protein
LGVPKLFQRRVEVLGRVQIVLKEKLNSAFTRISSHSHASKDGLER